MQGAGDPDALGYPADPAITPREKRRLSMGNDTMREVTQRPASWEYLNPFSALWGIWKGRDLLNQLARRNIEVRYKGTMIGLIWMMVTPLVMLAVYTFVFGVVLKAHGGVGFIGSNLTGVLLKAGHQVRALDNFSTGKRENLVFDQEYPSLERDGH